MISFPKEIVLFLLSALLCACFSAQIANDGPILHLQFESPLHPTVYQVVKGSLTGVQKVLDDPNRNTLSKNEEFTAVVDVSSPIYNTQREWYEMSAFFCYGKSIEECMNRNRSYTQPYLVRPSSSQTPVPFMVPFSKLHNVTSSDGKAVYVSGAVHYLFKTFLVNGARYDTSSGLLASFSAVSSQQAGQISGIDFARDTKRVLKHQPLIQCYFVEWSTDGCVPGLNYMLAGYDVKFMQIKGRRWLKAVDFPHQRDNRYLQTFNIPGIGQKNYLVFKDMTLEKVSPIANPFSYLFKSVEERVQTTLKSVGLTFAKGAFVGSGKYESYSKHYTKKTNSVAMSGAEFLFFRAVMSSSFLEDETNWDDSFRIKWKSIFHQSKKGNAMDFFREYGTHYVVEAVMGGRQETIFTINYCEINKEKAIKLEFEADLKKPYKFYPNGVGIEAYYKNMVAHKSKKIFISGPETTCIGGNSLDTNTCKNLTIWKSTVLGNPYPIRMTLKPFYSFVKDYEDRVWMEKMYKEYLKNDLDEVEVNHDINLKAECKSSEGTRRGLRHTMKWIITVSIAVIVLF